MSQWACGNSWEEAKPRVLDVGREVMGAELPRALRQGQNCLAIGCIAAHLCKTRKGGAPSVMVAPTRVGQPPGTEKNDLILVVLLARCSTLRQRIRSA